jgi:hypothetical protein
VERFCRFVAPASGFPDNAFEIKPHFLGQPAGSLHEMLFECNRGQIPAKPMAGIIAGHPVARFDKPPEEAFLHLPRQFDAIPFFSPTDNSQDLD